MTQPTTPAVTVHACPTSGSSITPCCGRTPLELPHGDCITNNPDAVTCTTTTPAEPGRRALRIRVLRETLHRLTTTDSGDSPTEDLAAATVRRVLAEMLADMTPSPDTDTPTTPAPVDPALVERVARALLTVQLHIGPNAIATAQSGRPIRLSGGEADRGAAAVLAELAPELARARQIEELLDIAHETSNRSEAERAHAVERAEQAETALAAGIPLVCSDDRHHAKVAALEAQVRRLSDLIDRLGPTEQQQRHRAERAEKRGHAVAKTAREERRRRRDAETALTEMRALLADLTDPDPCWYDHHGYCQAHGWFVTTPACPHARAKVLTGPAEENQP